MNREIIFKAKRKDNGEWVEGYLFEFQSGQYMICDRKEYDRPSTMPVLYFFKFCSYEIEISTLCQFTGLTDKNGRKIWENDIIKTSQYGVDNGDGRNFAGFDIFSISFSECSFCLMNKWRRFNLRPNRDMEAIGNIFDGGFNDGKKTKEN